MIQALQFMGLMPILASSEFTEMEIQGTAQDLPIIRVKPLHGEESGKTFRIYEKARKLSQVVDAEGVLNALSDYFDRGYQTAVCKTEREQTIYTRTPKGVRIKSEPLRESRNDEVRFEVKYLLESPRIRRLLIELGILTKEAVIRREQYNKLIQIKNFLAVIHEILPQLREQRPLHILDGACGKSYLSFVLYHFVQEEWGIDARFQCIDTRQTLIERCRQISQTLSYSQMEFFESTIESFKSSQPIDLLYSLHGCDTATDEAIAAGVRLNSRAILVVPCCHFELRSQLHRHPLKALTKFGLFEERFAALLTDALRALALEVAGYEVSTFRFVTDDISPKNTLLRALKREAPKPQALQQYRELRNMFGVSPAIERLLPSIFTDGVTHAAAVK